MWACSINGANPESASRDIARTASGERSRTLDTLRITFVQHGDYREAALRLASGGEETYYAQRYSVDFVAQLASQTADVSVACVAAEAYDERLPSGVRVVGMGRDAGSFRTLLDWLSRQPPTHLVPRTPSDALLRWALERGVRTLPLLADSFGRSDLRARLRHWRLQRQLNRSPIAWVGNHNFNASRDLARIGVDARKIIPWDWPVAASPHQFAARHAAEGCRIFYVGQLAEAKGLGDVILALPLLQRLGLPATLTVVGAGQQAVFEKLAQDAGVASHVQFLGRIGHARVIEHMQSHDVVVVPSRHEYPEGLPMSIYDALSSRTPLVLSDHPMFAGKVEHGVSALVFRARSPEDLAGRIQELARDPALYRRLSEQSAQAWDRLRAPVLWGELIDRWLRDADDDRRWLAARSLAACAPDASGDGHGSSR